VIRAVFLDRDGVINKKAPEGDYVKSWHEFEFLPGVAEAIRILNNKDYKVIVITNQRGVALGRMSEGAVEAIHMRMTAELQQRGVIVDRVYCCPHEKDSCSCRKPAPGMLLEAKKDFPELSFEDSFVIGDSINDMEAGKALSCKCILIANDLPHPPSDAWYESARSLYDVVKRFF
jgi:D-glycero-D-manno-heptose 1,7-bisphosphate phosphatase